MRILVTGVSGFVGSHLAFALSRRGHEIAGLCRPECRSEFHSNLSYLGSNIPDLDLFSCDLTDLDGMMRATRGVDVVYHLAAQTHVPDSVASPTDTVRSNIVGTSTMLEAARRSSVKKIINAGTDKVYGQAECLPIDELHPLKPLSPYDMTKMVAEQICMMYHRAYGLEVSLPRFSNIYGPRQDRRKLVPDLVSHILRGLSPIVRSDGTPRRDFVFIDDAVAAYLKLLETSSTELTINFGSGKPTRIIDLCNLLIDLSGASVRPTIAGQSQPLEIHDEYLCIKRASDLLDWRPEVSLQTGLKRTYEWYMENPGFLGA